MKIVEYKTFIEHLQNGSITDVSIYDFSGDIELTYNFENERYATKGPFGLNRDPLLQDVLDSKSIQYTLLSEEHPGSKNSIQKAAEYSSLLLFLIPVLLVVAVVIQATTIKRLTKIVEGERNGI